jgi:hypothetical protein
VPGGNFWPDYFKVQKDALKKFLFFLNKFGKNLEIVQTEPHICDIKIISF